MNRWTVGPESGLGHEKIGWEEVEKTCMGYRNRSCSIRSISDRNPVGINLGTLASVDVMVPPTQKLGTDRMPVDLCQTELFPAKIKSVIGQWWSDNAGSFGPVGHRTPPKPHRLARFTRKSRWSGRTQTKGRFRGSVLSAVPWFL